MPEIIKHKEGMFSFADLQTNDLDAATTFYTDLFGWKTDDQDMGEGPDNPYRMFTKNGQVVSAVSRQRPEQVAQGMPPMWNVYFTVSDVDLKAKEAEAAGGTVIMPPFDVLDAGRMAVIADPAGAVSCLWQPKESIGATVMHEPNTLDWAESGSKNVEAARRFYTDVLGWNFDEMDMGEGKSYTLFKIGNDSVAGLMEVDEMPMSYWSMYFNVEDCKSMTEKVRQMGGNVILEPGAAEGVGTFSIVTDPQGAMFGMITPDQAG